MIHQIETMQDVVMFIEQIAKEIDNFHPLDDFHDYVYPDTYFRRYTDEEASNRNIQLEMCIQVCENQNADFYNFLPELFEQAKDILPRTEEEETLFSYI